MKRYFFKGLDSTGRIETGQIEAINEADAFAQLKSHGISIYELDQNSPHQAPWYAREVSLGNRGHRLSDQAAIAELLGLLTGLDLPLTKALETAAESAPTPALKRHLQRMTARIADGATLIQAFNESGSGFSPIFGQILLIAENSNTLPESMNDLALVLRRTDRLRSRVSAALIYPMILIVAGLALLFIIALYLAPALQPVFTSLEKPMPWLLRTLLAGGQILHDNSVVLLPGVAFILATLTLFSLSPQATRPRALIIGALPFFSTVMHEAQLLHQFSALSILLRNGMGLPDALDYSAGMIPDGKFTSAFRAASENLKLGGSAVEGMGAVCRMPPLVVRLFSFGEETNQMGRMADTISGVLEKSIELKIERALQLLTPLLTLFIGGAIGSLVYSVMSAILDVNTGTF